MKTTLYLTPWARARLSPQTRIELVKRTSRLGVRVLFIGAHSSTGPYWARLADAPDRVVVGLTPWETADRLLREREGRPIAV